MSLLIRFVVGFLLCISATAFADSAEEKIHWSPQELGVVGDFMLAWGEVEKADRHVWVRTRDPKEIVMVSAFYFTDSIDQNDSLKDSRQDGWVCGDVEYTASEKARAALRKALWQTGHVSVDGGGEAGEYCDHVISAAVDLIAKSIASGEGSKVAECAGDAVGILIPFQTKKGRQTNYDRLCDLMSETEDSMTRQSIFGFLFQHADQRQTLCRRYIDDRDPQIAYYTAEYLVKLGVANQSQACTYVTYAWRFFEQGEPIPQHGDFWVKPSYEPPFDALKRLIDKAPILYTLEDQLAWIQENIDSE